MDSKLNQKMCNYEGESRKNNKLNKSLKDKQQNCLGILHMNILETCNFTNKGSYCVKENIIWI